MPSRAAGSPPAGGIAATAPCTSPVQQLAQASRALWSATLALMTAYMQTPAPAHRLLLARRIARNFETLARQEECFDTGCCATFGRLARRWQARAEQLAREQDGAARRGLMRLLS